MIAARKTTTILLGAVAAWLAYVAVSVPMIAMTGPTLLAMTAAGGAWLAWPKTKKEDAREAR